MSSEDPIIEAHEAAPVDPQTALYAALARAQGQLANLPPTGKGKVQLRSGGSYEYTYVEYDKLTDATRPVFAAEGLALIFVSTVQDGLRGMSVALTHKDGGILTWFSPFASEPTTEQLLGIAESYRRRYVTHGITGTAADRDHDGAIETAAAIPQPATKPTPARTPEQAGARTAQVPSVPDDVKSARNRFYRAWTNAGGNRSDKDGIEAYLQRANDEPRLWCSKASPAQWDVATAALTETAGLLAPQEEDDPFAE